MDQKGGLASISVPGGKGHKIRLPSRHGNRREEKGAVIYLDQFPEALKIQTGSENHWRYLALRFAIRSTTSAFPFCKIPRRPPFQSLRKKKRPIKALSK